MDGSSVCVECGKSSDQELYREFTGGTIQLSQCVSLLLYSEKHEVSVSTTFHERGSRAGRSLGTRLTLSFSKFVQPACKRVLDKYVEFDAVILLLDVLLLRIQSYRHLIFNYGITPSVRI